MHRHLLLTLAAGAAALLAVPALTTSLGEANALDLCPPSANHIDSVAPAGPGAVRVAGRFKPCRTDRAILAAFNSRFPAGWVGLAHLMPPGSTPTPEQPFDQTVSLPVGGMRLCLVVKYDAASSCYGVSVPEAANGAAGVPVVSGPALTLGTHIGPHEPLGLPICPGCF
jgi:hypothetical protein